MHPAKLAVGLRNLALERGITIYENTPVLEIVPGVQPLLRSAGGTLSASKLVLAANAWLSAIPELHPYLYVVSSQVIATVPVPELLAQIGWTSGA